ncbi:MAG: hypothetical protein IH971_09370, partial [Candidatus Marinimicrobia bacterium]|nr:hypothetical protein [Candidatus Neomarinimicrobiota bacterium]
MSDSINLNDALSQFSTGEINLIEESDDSDESEETRGAERGRGRERSDEARRGGRDQLRAAFARSRRSRPAVVLDFSAAARAAGGDEPEGEDEAGEAPAARERGSARRALQQGFQQARQELNRAAQPAATGGGAAAVPVGIEGQTAQVGQARVGNQQPAAGPAQGLQAGGRPATISANDPPPQLDGVRVAASFEQTALGFALAQGRSPAEQIAARGAQNQFTQSFLQTRLASAAIGAGDRGGFAIGSAAENGPTIVGNAAEIRTGDAEDIPGPLGRIQGAGENPGGAPTNLLDPTAQAGTPPPAGGANNPVPAGPAETDFGAVTNAGAVPEQGPAAGVGADNTTLANPGPPAAPGDNDNPAFVERNVEPPGGEPVADPADLTAAIQQPAGGGAGLGGETNAANAAGETDVPGAQPAAAPPNLADA